MSNPFRYFNSTPEVIRLVVMMSVRYPLSLRNVNQERHLVTRQVYKQMRAGALAEWRALAA